MFEFMKVNISVIICSYNREKYIADAVLSLIAQDYDPHSFEVIIVDNNSKDNTMEVCRKIIQDHPSHKIQYASEMRQGSSFARNAGALLASGKLLCFMDDDAVAERDYLSNIWRFHIENPTVHGFGGRIIPRYIPEEPAWMSYYVSSLVGHFHYADSVKEFAQGKYPLESNMVVSAASFAAVNGFNPELPGVKGDLRIGGEGKDLFFRIRANGHSIFYVPNMVVHHVVETGKLTREYMYRVASGIGRGERQRVGKSSYAIFKKTIEYLFKWGASVVIGLYYIFSGRPAKALPVIRFRVDVLKGFFDSR
jgi:glucosyl-dolichyl phosphate glucuronosyltransferase